MKKIFLMIILLITGTYLFATVETEVLSTTTITPVAASGLTIRIVGAYTVTGLLANMPVAASTAFGMNNTNSTGTSNGMLFVDGLPAGKTYTLSVKPDGNFIGLKTLQIRIAKSPAQGDIRIVQNIDLQNPNFQVVCAGQTYTGVPNAPQYIYLSLPPYNSDGTLNSINVGVGNYAANLIWQVTQN